MSSLTSLAVRIARLAALRQTPIQETKAEILAQRICEHFLGANPSPEAIANIGADQILSRLSHYKESGADIFAQTGSAIDRLEAANRAEAAKQRRDGIGAAPKKKPMTDKERAEFAALSPEHKLAWADGTLLCKEFKNNV